MKTFTQVQIGLNPFLTHPDFLGGSFYNWFKAMRGDICEIARPNVPFGDYDMVMVGCAKYEIQCK